MSIHVRSSKMLVFLHYVETPPLNADNDERSNVLYEISFTSEICVCEQKRIIQDRMDAQVSLCLHCLLMQYVLKFHMLAHEDM